jgi:hypothetical protein
MKFNEMEERKGAFGLFIAIVEWHWPIKFQASAPQR